jgi:hypothetical protein
MESKLRKDANEISCKGAKVKPAEPEIYRRSQTCRAVLSAIVLGIRDEGGRPCEGGRTRRQRFFTEVNEGNEGSGGVRIWLGNGRTAAKSCRAVLSAIVLGTRDEGGRRKKRKKEDLKQHRLPPSQNEKPGGRIKHKLMSTQWLLPRFFKSGPAR